MNIKLINLDTDYDLISSWYTKRNLNVPTRDSYSKIGFMAGNVCAAWLYQTDSKYCLIENAISDSDSTKEQRDQATDMLLEMMIKTATELGYKTMLTYTNHPSLMKKENEKFGFVITDLKLLCRSL